MAQSRTLIHALIGAMALAAAGAAPVTSSYAADAPNDGVALQTLSEEITIAGLLNQLRDRSTAELTVLRNVRIVDPADASVHDNQSVIMNLGGVLWVGDRTQEPAIADARVIDGGGRFASPGLTDMHVHSESTSSDLLNLANGVTTIREMGGFPWLLAARDAVSNDRMVGPTRYVAGTILNYAPLEGYAVIVRDGETARRVVRQQAACGYDFIKVHNVMPARVFDVIASEAQRMDMDLVGHVPHNMTVRYAAEHGMRTMEHLKGYLNDANLQLGDTDYAVANSPNLWFTPTLYAGRGFTTHDQQIQMLRAPAAAYVPRRVRAAWQAMTIAAQDGGFQLNIHAQVLMRQITTQLIAQHAQFLAGTDAAGYPFQTMGFALVDELRLLHEAGLSNADAIRAATTAPAAAMRDGANFGRIARGMRADIVLTDANPLTDLTAYTHNAGIIARGRSYPRAALDHAMSQLAALYAAPPAHADPDTLAANAETAVAEGIVFNARILEEAAQALRRDGHAAAAERIARLAIAPTSGACAAITQ